MPKRRTYDTNRLYEHIGDASDSTDEQEAIAGTVLTLLQAGYYDSVAEASNTDPEDWAVVDLTKRLAIAERLREQPGE